MKYESIVLILEEKLEITFHFMQMFCYYMMNRKMRVMLVYFAELNKRRGLNVNLDKRKVLGEWKDHVGSQFGWGKKVEY